jgi:hypothetical protein
MPWENRLDSCWILGGKNFWIKNHFERKSSILPIKDFLYCHLNYWKLTLFNFAKYLGNFFLFKTSSTIDSIKKFWKSCQGSIFLGIPRDHLGDFSHKCQSMILFTFFSLSRNLSCCVMRKLFFYSNCRSCQTLEIFHQF